MIIIDLIRLLRKHLVLLILVPLIMAAIVIYLTRNPKFRYASETTLYTGIASGTSIEMNKSFNFFATNNAFDNLINVIKSRNTQQETAIRLLALHLMLPVHDDKYISRASYSRLHEITPDVIKNLTIESKEFSEPISQTIEDDFEVIKSEQVPVGQKVSNVPEARNIPDVINLRAYEQTVQNLIQYMQQNDTNYVYKLLNFHHPHYSLKAISSVTAQRIANSDLVRLKYENDDPGVCQLTLAILTEVCVKNYKDVKENRSDVVVRYFEEQLAQSSERLKAAEDKLLDFNKANNIINYYEQSKAVAVVKEQLGVNYNEKVIHLHGVEAARKKLEEKLGIQQNIQLKSSGIIEKRNRLSDLNYIIATIEITGSVKSISDVEMTALYQEAEKLQSDLKEDIGAFYGFKNTIDGMPVSALLDEWMENVVEYEKTKAGIEVLSEQIDDFQKQYEVYAPAGANIKRIEREISVSEQEYLQILHGLNLARLKLQDNELASEIRAIDPPYFPLSPIPTKRKIMIVLAAMVGFISTLAFIFLAEYFDDTLRNSQRANKILGLQSFGVIPKFLLKTKGINFPFIINRLLELIIQNIQLGTGERLKRGGPLKILIFSSLSKEGKTVLLTCLSRKFKQMGKQVVALSYSRESLRNYELSQIGYSDTPSSVSKSGYINKIQRFSVAGWLLGYPDFRIDFGSDFLKSPETALQPDEYFDYDIDKDFFSSPSFAGLVKDTAHNDVWTQADCVLVELPPILHYPFPVNVVADADISLLVCRANRVWSEADKNALSTIKEVTKQPVSFVLNGVELPALELVLGDLPKKRSRIRRVIKNIIRLQFHSRNQL